ncbi:molecular chaperone [Providencia vermicola]|uniref:Molecular chaperone n=1 Tax=Providencia vermicola TaxID=333965 RepID=A0AAX3RXS2_9GAMM|nr:MULTISPECIES: molecular chaperone [Providencia]ELX8377936.1 molecular chaperone [Providencia stuartii]EMD5257477.1 molecular chaperone [Providencia stuartii]MTB39793.1 molecular chaperone [Providencia sp. wls1949]MTC06759.1 molecular chaperone [Providencia sp. wls1948]QIC17342.1 molecular chaperone [Providencia vermicola]
MFIGFDYGTSNCAVAIMDKGTPTLLPLEGDNAYIPSTLCAPTRESVSEHLFRHLNITPSDAIGEQILRRSLAYNREEGIELAPEDIVFGQAALDLYLKDPRDVYYVKSPKSFLGASGLHEVQISFFEDLVCAMMANIKYKAEQHLQQRISDTVIGRPINFHGRGGELANQQAEAILVKAAKRAGFKNIAFQFEPVAAGLEYESTLHQDQTVLVVDIGGGTTDCSLIRMGPTYRHKTDRTESLLAHSGQRVGGNDLDIYLALKQLMDQFGMSSQTVSGIKMPISQFWNPIAINNVEAQKDFYAKQNFAALNRLRQDAQEPEKLIRLIEVYHDTLGYSLVRRAEEAKIALSNDENYLARIPLTNETLEINIHRDQMVESIESPKSKMIELVKEAVNQGGVQPDVIFMTGGSAQSPVLSQAIQQQLPNIPIVRGNDFGSVTAGLTRWAEICFK